MPVAPSTSLGCDDAPESYWTVEMPSASEWGSKCGWWGHAPPSPSHTQDAAPPLCSERTTPHLLSLVGPGPRPRVQGHTAQALLPEAGGNDTAAAGLGGPGGGRAGQPTHGASCLLPRLSPSPGGRRREPGEASGLLSLLPLCASSVLPYPVPVSQDLPVPPQAEGKVGSLPWTLVHPPLAVSPAEGDLAAVCSQVVRGAAQGLRDLRTSAPF